MLKKLEVQSLRADLGAVEGLLADRTPGTDPIGFLQLSQRQSTLRARLATVEATVEHKAAVGLFFAGGPVIGSRGIDASFAAKAVGLFQDMVSKQFAMEEVGDLGRRGPVAMQPNSDLIVTNVIRGSVGLLLEEAGVSEAFADTQLKVVVDHVVDTVMATAAPAADEFEQALERMDPRFLTSLGEFFEVMDERSAVLRLVESEREVELNADAIRRGRERAGAATILDSDEEEMIGRIFILPAARRFELRVLQEGTTLVGGIARAFSQPELERVVAAENVVGELWRVRIKTRTVTRPTRPPKVTYTLVGLVAPV